MKIKCINKYGWKYLTKNKIYEVINEDGGWCWIINDIGNECWYPKYLFKPLNEIRNNKIDNLLK